MSPRQIYEVMRETKARTRPARNFTELIPHKVEKWRQIPGSPASRFDCRFSRTEISNTMRNSTRKCIDRCIDMYTESIHAHSPVAKCATCRGLVVSHLSAVADFRRRHTLVRRAISMHAYYVPARGSSVAAAQWPHPVLSIHALRASYT